MRVVATLADETWLRRAAEYAPWKPWWTRAEVQQYLLDLADAEGRQPTPPSGLDSVTREELLRVDPENVEAERQQRLNEFADTVARQPCPACGSEIELLDIDRKRNQFVLWPCRHVFDWADTWAMTRAAPNTGWFADCGGRDDPEWMREKWQPCLETGTGHIPCFDVWFDTKEACEA
jgi:hypothetical protein